MKFNVNKDEKPIIKVIGVGGGGSNAVSYMYQQGIVGVDFAICNTDNQAIEKSPVPNRIQLGPGLTEGRGAGSKPAVGKEACLESIEDIKAYFANGTKMLFVTAGMGGGTGTGAAPVVAKAAKEMDILTVGIVTMPFRFEGRRRLAQAKEGLEEMRKNVDTLVVISNDKLSEMYGGLAVSDAFSKADDILTTAAKGIAEIITITGLVNVDFEDVNTVMRDSGRAVMGIAETEGENRAQKAIEMALQSPLLEDNDIRGARNILINITSGTKEVTMDEVTIITEYVQDAAGEGTDLIWGNCTDTDLGERLSVTVIATGFANEGSRTEKTMRSQVQRPQTQRQEIVPPPSRKRISLDDDDTSQGANSYIDNLDKKKDFEQTYQEDRPIDPEEPYSKSPEEEEHTRFARKQALKNASLRLNNPEAINELENQPAYLRKGVQLGEQDGNYSKSRHARLGLAQDDEGESEIDRVNSYLEDSLD